MHEGRIPVRVMLCNGKGWTGDGFLDPGSDGKTLHEGGFACSKRPLKQKNGALWQLLGQLYA